MGALRRLATKGLVGCGGEDSVVCSAGRNASILAAGGGFGAAEVGGLGAVTPGGLGAETRGLSGSEAYDDPGSAPVVLVLEERLQLGLSTHSQLPLLL